MKVKIALSLVALACGLLVADAHGQIITSVVRAGGQSHAGRLPIGPYDGSTLPLATEEGGLKDGNLPFSDREFPWSLTPTERLPGSLHSLLGSEYIRTFNGDKDIAITGVSYTVTISRLALVWVSCDDRIPAEWNDGGALTSQQDAVDLATAAIAPAGTFTDTGLDLSIHENETTDRKMSVYAAVLPAGTYVFGRQNSGKNFYTIGAVEGPIVRNPSPANGQTEIAVTGTQLQWEVLEPDPGPKPAEYRIYFGDTALAADPNEGDTYLIGTAAAEGDGVYTAPLDTLYGGLDYGAVYYWRVDVDFEGDANDANSLVGTAWHFETVTLKPIIITQPQDQSAGPGCPVTLSVEAISGSNGAGGTLRYQWYADGVLMPGQTQSTVVVSEPGVVYHCVVTNDHGSTASEGAQVKSQTTPLLFPEGLLGYWPLDGDATDASGNGFDLTQSGNPQFVPGKVGQAIRCDGVGDYLSSTAFGQSLNGKAALSIVMWIKSDIINTDRGFIIFVDPADQDRRGIRYDSAGSNSGGDDVLKYGVAGSNGQQQELETPALLQTTEWQHIALTWSGAGENIKFYINGELIAPASTDTQATGTLEGYAVLHLGLGSKDINMAGQGWDGLIDDVAILERVLSQEEIQVLASGSGGWAPTDPTYDPPATEDGWINPTAPVTLGWTKAEFGPCDATYRVLLGNEPNDLAMAEVGTTQDTSIEVPASSLDYDLTYYWTVIVERGGESTHGAYWSFETVKRVPVVLADPAAYVAADAGSTVTLSAEVSCLKVVPMTKYVWLKEGDPSFAVTVNNPEATSETEDSYIYTCTLALENMDIAKEGRYYCTLFNSATGTEDFTETARSLVLIERLMLHYTFDEIVGNSVADFSPSGITGTLTSRTVGGTPIYGGIEPGMVDGAIRLLGDTDPNSAFVETGKTSGELGVDGNKPRTVSVWAKVRSFNNGGIWDAGTYNSTLGTWGIRTFIDDTYRVDRWRIQHWGSDNDFTVEGSTNMWLHFVYVYDGSRFQVYVNGQQRLDVARDLNTGNDVTLHVGAYQANVLDGVIDDFRLYNHALSAKDILQLYVDVAGGSYCAGSPEYDFDGDCKVDLADFAAFAAEWLNSSWIIP